MISGLQKDIHECANNQAAFRKEINLECAKTRIKKCPRVWGIQITANQNVSQVSLMSLVVPVSLA